MPGPIPRRLGMKCPRCQQQSRRFANFCDECGTPFGPSTEGGRPAASYGDLQRALNEALRQQTATSEMLRIISSSPTDVQPVLDAIVKSASRLCDSVDGVIFRLHGDRLRLAAHHGPIAAQGQIGTTDIPLIPGLVNARAVLERRAIHVADLQAEGVDFPEGSELARRLGMRTTLCVPLLREGVAIGVIALRRAETRPFADRQIELLQTFADQAVIALEYVRLFTEAQEKNQALRQARARVSEALEQQTATGEILRAIAHTPTDTQPVFDTIVRSGARLCNAATAALLRTDGTMLFLPANYGSSPEVLATARALFPRPLDMTTAAGTAILTRSVIQIPDSEDPSASEFVRQGGRLLGYRSSLAVPMLRGAEAIGAIRVTRREPSRFSDVEVELLKTFADQAVIAIENVRLFTELQARNTALSESLEQQTATSEILRIISSSPTDVQPVFETIISNAVRLCDTQEGSVFRFDGHLIHLVASETGDAEFLTALQRVFPRAPGRDSPTARAILTGAVTHVPDILADPDYKTPSTFGPVRRRTILSVPMLREGRPIGAITVGRHGAQPFSDKQIALLETFASQAVIAVENVRLFTELQEKNLALTRAHGQVTQALEQQTATSDILRVMSSSPTAAQPVFEAIADSAVRLTGAVIASVYEFDGAQIHLRVIEPADWPHGDEFRRHFPRSPAPDFAAGRVILERAVLHHADLWNDSKTPELTREWARRMDLRSVLWVPMLREGEPIGVIGAVRRESGFFGDEQVRLLQTFADQAVIAIENVRLFTELQARTRELTRTVEQLTALGEVGRAVSSTLDLETVLTTIVSRAVLLSGLDGGVVFEYDEGAQEFVQRVATESGVALGEARRPTRIRKGEGVLGRTAITLEPVQVPDITTPAAYEGRLRETLITAGIRAILAVPMVREGRLLGCLGVTRNRPGQFPAETVELLRTLATQSALAIQNARLFHEIEDKRRQLEIASQHKSEFLANMSHELRTPLNAVIGFSEVLGDRMFGELNEKQAEYVQDINASGTHLLSLINDILDLSKIEAGRMELDIGEFDVPTVVETAVLLTRERAGRRGILLRVEIDERVGMVHGDERKIKQVLLNLLSNAIKFTPEGGRIAVRATLEPEAVEISVADTGIGIAPEDHEAIFEEFRQVGTAAKKVEGTGLGLTLSRKFVELHGGRIWVTSTVGEGSAFTFTLPVRCGT
jgi:GAF domain-containing protein